MKYITVEIAIAVNQRVCKNYGGASGVRSIDRLEAAVDRVRSGYILHPHRQAVAMLQSIAHDHPLHDGNKRTAYALMQSMIYSSGYRLDMTEDEKYQLVMEAVRGADLDALFLKVVTCLLPIGE